MRVRMIKPTEPMRTFIDYVAFTTGTLAFCGLLAWIESTPMSDAPVHQFANAFTAVLNLIGL